MGRVGAGDEVFFHVLHLAAEKLYRALGGVQLIRAVRPLHRDERAALFRQRQAQLAQQIQPRDGAGAGNIEARVQLHRRFLGAGMDAPHVVKAEQRAGVAQKADALVETVKQRQLHVRTGYLQREAGKARARADVDNAPAAEVRHAQQRRAVEEMQARHVLLAAYRGEIHDGVHFFEMFKIYAVARGGAAVRRHAERGKARGQGIFKKHMFLRMVTDRSPSGRACSRTGDPCGTMCRPRAAD